MTGNRGVEGFLAGVRRGIMGLKGQGQWHGEEDDSGACGTGMKGN